MKRKTLTRKTPCAKTIGTAKDYPAGMKTSIKSSTDTAGYTVRVWPGRLIFEGEQVDSIIDAGDMTATFSSDFSAIDLARMAFSAGITRGIKMAARDNKGGAK